MTTTNPQRVYVVGYDSFVTSMWFNQGFEIVRNPEIADILSFIGGPDVDPKYYGQVKGPHRISTYAPDDIRDSVHWERSIDLGQKAQIKVGICRGGQFLNCMNNGTMYQHVDNHTFEHNVYDTLLGGTEPIRVTSSHHQMMIPSKDAEVIAYTENLATEFWDQAGKCKDKPPRDIEVLWYEDTRSLCFQPHPEWTCSGSGDDKRFSCRDYFFNVFEMVR